MNISPLRVLSKDSSKKLSKPINNNEMEYYFPLYV